MSEFRKIMEDMFGLKPLQLCPKCNQPPEQVGRGDGCSDPYCPHDLDWVRLSPSEVHDVLSEICQRIESCGASLELTRAVVLATDLRMGIGNPWNQPDKYAVNRVRAEMDMVKGGTRALADAGGVDYMENDRKKGIPPSYDPCD